MLCAELEELEAQFDDVVNALENPNLTRGAAGSAQGPRSDEPYHKGPSDVLAQKQPLF